MVPTRPTGSAPPDGTMTCDPTRAIAPYPGARRNPEAGGERMPQLIQLTINGAQRQVAAETERSLLVVLREELGLTGAKYGCAVVSCGACTVLVYGASTRACITAASEVSGREVKTNEGIATHNEPHPVQAAMLAVGAMQCGSCTPGMVLAAAELLSSYPDPDDAQIIDAL